MNNKILIAILSVGILLVVLQLGKDSDMGPTANSVNKTTTALDSKTNQTSEDIELESGAFFFKPDTITAPAGEISIKVKNNQGYHTFVIDELDVKEVINTGQTIKFAASPGTYTYYCDVPGHREQGQEGTLIVE